MSGAPSRWVLALCARVAACTDVAGGITRLFLSPATREVHAILRGEMEALGMRVRVDAAGNLRGMYDGERAGAPVLLMGSHVDTVPHAGAFDGVLGVAVALAVVRGLAARRLRYAVEVIAFSEEEGIRFGMPFIGSRAVVGTLGAAEMARADADGMTVREVLDGFGLSAAGSAELTPGTFGFVECHLEQGPVLEALRLPLGVVTAVVGQTRLELTFTGVANHAGTTPMPLRKDALAAAAGWISRVEEFARAREGLVATVGRIAVSPGAANVIVGKAVVSLDVRHADDGVREQAVEELVEAAAIEGAKRGVGVAVTETSRQDAVGMDARLVEELAEAVAGVGAQAHRMVSGAGHDAMILAEKVPSAMLFVRTPRGLSHHPEEAVLEGDVEVAVEALGALLGRLENWV